MADLLREGAERELYAGATVAVFAHNEPRWLGVAGNAAWVPARRPVRLSTPFDLASLTKVLSTTPIALRLCTAGKLDLDAPLSEVLPGCPPGITARHCLRHTSGLPAWAQLAHEAARGGWTWGSEATRDRVLRGILATPVTADPGERHCYSDLGMLLLSAALEHVGGARLDRLFEREVRASADVDLRWGWPEAAATEHCPVRQRILAGEVHDLNCAVLGGFAGHAGLFGAADQVAAAGAWQLRAWAGDSATGISASLMRGAFTATGLGGHGLGWDTVTPSISAAGPLWSAEGVGHLGFTGTSLYLDPARQLSVAVLTNRVHPMVEGGSVPNAPVHPRYRAFKAWRPAVHSAIVNALNQG